MDHPFLLDFPHRDPLVILNGGQRFWKGPQTGLVAAGGDSQPQRVMGAVVVIDRAPFAQRLLEVALILPLRLGEDLTRQGAMKPFIFAHGLRMIGATMADPNTDV